jgi:hypothetical protein
MSPFLEIAEITTGQPERFAVISIDPTRREGTGCLGLIQSLHMTHSEAADAIAKHREHNHRGPHDQS